MKKGFTLAEILIALAILGVIAALTVPSLMVNAQKQQAASALMKELNTLTQASKMILADNDARDMWAACAIPGSGQRNEDFEVIRECYAPYLNGTIIDKETTRTYKYDLNNNYSPTFKYGGMTTPDGFLLLNESVGTGGSGWTHNPYINFVLDINGAEKGPNQYCKDVFEIYITMQGNALAHGSKAHINHAKELNQPGIAANMERNKCTSKKINDPHFCAGSIVDNGGKVIYPW